jgi:hypothetical protein
MVPAILCISCIAEYSTYVGLVITPEYCNQPSKQNAAQPYGAISLQSMKPCAPLEPCSPPVAMLVAIPAVVLQHHSVGLALPDVQSLT